MLFYLLFIIRTLKEFKGVSYCSPGHRRDKKVKSEESLTGNKIVIIWTGHRVSSFFQGALNKKSLSKEVVMARVLQFQQKFSKGLVVIDECHTAMTDTFRESAASARLIKEVRLSIGNYL